MKDSGGKLWKKENRNQSGGIFDCIRLAIPVAQFRNVNWSKFASRRWSLDFDLLAVAGAVESVESVFYFPSWLRESAKRLLFLNQRQSPQRLDWVTFLNCATICPRVTF
jgi:hypothetical protein